MLWFLSDGVGQSLNSCNRNPRFELVGYATFALGIFRSRIAGALA